MIPFHSADQQAFSLFYEAYAPKLWGIIVLAKLPLPKSETILVNTLARAWQQFEPHTLNRKPILSHLLALAHQEGLPIDHLKAMPRFNRSDRTG